MTDKFKSNAKGLESPADEHFIIVPDDDADLTLVPRVIYIGSGGSLVVRDKSGVDATYYPTDNSYILFRAIRVLDTGTTASNLIGNL